LITESFGRLLNGANEVVAEGNCQIDAERGSVTLRPLVDTPLIGRLDAGRLELDDGSELAIERVIRFRLNAPGVPPGPSYRLYFHVAEELPAVGGDE
jgi:hypothetical protein